MKKSSTLFLLLFTILAVKNGTAQTWAPLASGTTTHLLGVSAPTATTVYVCGAVGTIRKSTTTGLTWAPLSSGTGQTLHSIYFTDVLNGFTVGDNGTALKTTNGGTTWSPMSVGTTVALRFVYFLDANNGYITGAGGLVLKTTDAGATWNPSTTGAGAQLSSIFFTSPTTGYSAGVGGVAIKTTTSASSWSPLTTGVSSSLGIVFFPSTSTGVICGDLGVILRTTTSGTAWGTIPSGTTDFLGGMDFYDANNGVIVGGNVALNTGIILQTTNAGASWTSTIPGTSRLTRADFFDGSLGYAVGLDGTLLQWTVASIADAQFTSSAPGCIAQSVNFYSVMAGTPGVTDSWDFGIGAIPATSTSSNPTGVLYSSAGAKIVTHISTTSLGSDTVTSIITINPSPSAIYTYTPPSCPGSAVNFINFGTTGSGVTYSWDFGAGASPLTSTGENPSGIVYNSGGPKTITFSVTNQYGCTTTSTQTFTVDSLPMAYAGMDSTICFNTSINLGDTTIAGMIYSWSPASSLNSSTISNPIASPVSPTTSYILTVTNTSTGCSNKDTVLITMLPALIANAGSDGEMCSNDSIQLGTGLLLGQTYSWSPTTNLSDSTTANPTAIPTATTTYTLTVSGYGCPTVTDEITITVHNAPSVSAGVDDTTTVGSSVQLNATGGILYVWTPSATLDNPGIYNPMASPSTTTTYTVVVTDLFGCRTSDAVKITVVEPAFWVPTAFTPNEDGNSDVFFVRGEGMLNFEFSIFNRWGEKIFLTKDFYTGWDGTRQSNGDKLPEGAYVYQIRGTLSDGKIVDSKGMINLIR